MVYKDFSDALVSVVPTLRLEDGESVEFEVESFPPDFENEKYRLTLEDKGGEDLYPRLESFFEGKWHPESRLLELCTAIELVRAARKEGIWLVK